jgi:hypothetical protein
MDAVNPQAVDALTITNVKSVGEAASFAMASLFQHQTNVARRVDSLSEAHLGKVLNSFSSIDPIEAVSNAKIFKAESDSSLMSILAQLATGSMEAKIAQSTPGDVSLELYKIGSSVASLQGVLGGLVALLQETIKGAQSTPPITF